MNARDVINTICQENQDITEINIVEFLPSPLLQNVDADSLPPQSVMKKIDHLRCSFNIPYWDAVNIGLYQDDCWNTTILKAAKFHQGTSREKPISPKELDFLDLRKANYGLLSKVKIGKGRILHIPMLDFHLPVNESSESMLFEISKMIGITDGWILNSGKSYHLIGRKLMSWDEMHKVLSLAILYGPITDVRWIAHQLLEGSCCLRIGYKYNTLPTVVSEVNAVKQTRLHL